MMAVTVSRETQTSLDAYERIIKSWNQKINLVSAQTICDFKTRHIADCLQLLDFAPHIGPWLDLGSGAGLPGLVIAIAQPCRRRVILVESDHRKAAFLRNVRRQLDLEVEVVSKRIETIKPVGARVVSARALAPLATLFRYQERHGGPDCVGLYPKGRQWESEVLATETEWSYDLHHHPSAIEPDSVILEVRNLKRMQAQR